MNSNKKSKLKKNNGGYIVVETLLSFMLLLFMIISILSLVNIVTLQARIHYAMTQTAQTISMYSYVLHVTGISGALANVDTQAGKAKVEISDFQNNLNGFIDGVGNLDENAMTTSGNALIAQGEKMVEDPSAMVAQIINLGVNAGADYLFCELVESLVGRYLSGSGKSGDDYLVAVNVVDGLEGLRFNKGSNYIDSEGTLTIVVEYDVEYQFGFLPLPFDSPQLRMSQAVKTKVLLGGEGAGYQDK